MKSFFCVPIIFSLTIVFVLCGFLSDGVNTFGFRQIQDGSGEFNFQYKLDSGELFRGQTFILNGSRANVHIMFGSNNSIYWTEFDDNELNSNSMIHKIVRRVERTNEGIYFKDDLIAYEFTISNGVLEVTPFLTKWDYKNICLTNVANNKEFRFEIMSKNNARRYEGTTFSVNKNPLVLRFNLTDSQFDATYEIDLVPDELDSKLTFCKEVSRTISEKAVLGAYAERTDNPKLIERLLLS